MGCVFALRDHCSARSAKFFSPFFSRGREQNVKFPLCLRSTSNEREKSTRGRLGSELGFSSVSRGVPITAEAALDQIQYTRFQMASSEVVHGGLGSKICHRRRGWVPRTQARADGCGRHLDRGERLNAALTMN